MGLKQDLIDAKKEGLKLAGADADAIKATTVTLNGITYQPAWFKNSTVVTE